MVKQFWWTLGRMNKLYGNGKLIAIDRDITHDLRGHKYIARTLIDIIKSHGVDF